MRLYKRRYGDPSLGMLSSNAPADYQWDHEMWIEDHLADAWNDHVHTRIRDARKDNSSSDDAGNEDAWSEYSFNEDARNDNACNNDTLKDDAQSDNPRNDGPQSDHSTQNDALTAVISPQVQNSALSLEYCLSTSYPILTSVMSNLNRMDFKNLQLAGLHTPISQEARMKHLVPSMCNDGFMENCKNTTRKIDEIRTCHGRHRDGQDYRGHREKWVEPPYLFKHVRGTDSFVQISNDNQKGHFDSFNVCIDCHKISLFNDETIEKWHSSIDSCLDHRQALEQRPFNTCRCKMFVEKHWRCYACTRSTLKGLGHRAKQNAPKVQKRGRRGNNGYDVCPIDGCKAYAIRPMSQHQMLFCRACTAIFPRIPELMDCGNKEGYMLSEGGYYIRM